MEDFVRIFESYYLFEVEIRRAKLADSGIDSYIKNEFINNVALMPVNQFYILYVTKENAKVATEILSEDESD